MLLGREADTLSFAAGERRARPTATPVRSTAAIRPDDEFCVYDETGSTPSLIMTLNAPAGGMCNGKPCWKESNSGFQYKDKLPSQYRLQQVKMKQGLVARKTQFQARARARRSPCLDSPLCRTRR